MGALQLQIPGKVAIAAMGRIRSLNGIEAIPSIASQSRARIVFKLLIGVKRLMHTRRGSDHTAAFDRVATEGKMDIVEVEDRMPDLMSKLVEVWEGSVRATHLFLSDAEIEVIKGYVPQALREVEHLVVAKSEADCPIAFMGVEDGTLEMLFVAPEARGKGLGSRLVKCGINDYAVEKLAVNEQNPQAKGFYEHMGFRVYKRTPLDEQGNPYPLLYMSLSDAR